MLFWIILVWTCIYIKWIDVMTGFVLEKILPSVLIKKNDDEYNREKLLF